METTIKALIALIFLTILVGGAVGGLSGATGIDHDAAEGQARQHAKALGLDVQGVTCARTDSDGDGYVSCSIAHRDAGNVQVLPVECAVAVTFNSGCRSQKPATRAR